MWMCGMRPPPLCLITGERGVRCINASLAGAIGLLRLGSRGRMMWKRWQAEGKFTEDTLFSLAPSSGRLKRGSNEYWSAPNAGRTLIPVFPFPFCHSLLLTSHLQTLGSLWFHKQLMLFSCSVFAGAYNHIFLSVCVGVSHCLVGVWQGLMTV